MDTIIIILIQLIFIILLCLFVRSNYKKFDNWLVILFSLPSLIPIIGGIVIFAGLISIFILMVDDDDLPDTKINRFLFKSKFGE